MLHTVAMCESVYNMGQGKGGVGWGVGVSAWGIMQDYTHMEL